MNRSGPRAGAPPSRGTGWRSLRRTFLFGLVLLVGAVLFLRTRLAADTACELARRHLPGLIGMDVGIGSCELDPLEQRVTLHGLSIFPKGSDDAVFAAERVDASLRRLRPLERGIQLELLRVVHPRISVDARTPKPGGKAVCPLEPLHQIAVNHLAIEGGEVRVALPEGRSVELTGLDVGWRVRRGVAEMTLNAEAGKLALGARQAPLPINRLSVEGGFDADSMRLELSRAELLVDEASLEVVGKIDDLCDPKLQLDAQAYLPMSALAKVAPVPEDAQGQAWARVLAQGGIDPSRKDGPRLSAEVVGTRIGVGKFQPGDFKARLSMVGDEVKLDELSFAAGQGTVKVDGSLKLAPSLPVKVHVDVSDAEFARILERVSLPRAWVDFIANGKGAVSGHLLPSPHLTGEADIHATHFLVAGHPFDVPDPKGAPPILTLSRGHVVTGLKILPDHVEFSDAKVETEHGRVDASVDLFYDPLKGISIRGAMESLDLSDFGPLAGIRWLGKGTGHFTVEGPMAHVAVDSELSFRDFAFWQFSLGVVQAQLHYQDLALILPSVTGQKGRTVYSASGELDFKPESQGGLRTAGQLFFSGGRTEDLIDMVSGLSPSIALLQGTLAGDADGAVLIDCPANSLDGVVKLNLKNTTYYARRVGDGAAVLRFVRGQQMVLEKSTLQGPLGTLTADGSFNFNGPMDYRFRGDGLQLAEIVGPARAKKLGVAGSLTLVGTVA